jgi:4-diphosphocytidyl-2-C-methyl-D-erythritol kinase
VKEATPKDTTSSLTVKAPAKINLFLKILHHRPDGYHEIESLMQKVDLFDTLHLSRQSANISLSCPGTTLPEDRGNLVYRAAQAFFSATGIKTGIKITLEKKIPIAAGLAGGSSDAAAVVIGMDMLFKTNLGLEYLEDIARPLGADVPFFVRDCSAAKVSGIGDRIQRTEPLKGISIVLVNPGFEVSTKWVYENFPLTSDPNPFILAPGRNVSNNLPDAAVGLCREIGNDLEKVTISRYPEIDDIKKELLDSGAEASLMSGSGPTVFGLFSNEDEARRSFVELKEKFGGNVFLTRPYIS